MVDVLPWCMSWLDVEVEFRRCVVMGRQVFLVGLRVCFSLGFGFGEFSSWVNRGGQAESQLKQKPCLMGCKNAELYFLDSDTLRS